MTAASSPARPSRRTAARFISNRRVMADAEIDKLLQLAYAAHGAGRRDEASALYERIIARAPQRPEAYVNLGLLHQDSGDLAAAEDWFRKAIAAAPKSPVAYVNLGVLLGK